MDIKLHKVAVVLQAEVAKLRKAEVLQGLVPQEIKKEWGGGMEELGKAEDLQGCQHPALQKV